MSKSRVPEGRSRAAGGACSQGDDVDVVGSLHRPDRLQVAAGIDGVHPGAVDGGPQELAGKEFRGGYLTGDRRGQQSSAVRERRAEAVGAEVATRRAASS